MREIVVEDAVIAFAEKRGWMHRKMQYRGRRGCPDDFFFGHGEIRIVEFKRPGKKDSGLSAHQVREHKRLRALGITIHVIDNIEDGNALFA